MICFVPLVMIPGSNTPDRTREQRVVFCSNVSQISKGKIIVGFRKERTCPGDKKIQGPGAGFDKGKTLGKIRSKTLLERERLLD